MSSLRRQPSLHRFFRAIALVGLIAGSALTCTSIRTEPEPALSSLVVRNRGYFDVNVYTMSSPGAPPARLGTVVGSSTATFALRSRDLQPGDILVVWIRAIGALTSWTSPGVSVGPGLVAVLDVSSDAFGDCSSSNLHTILIADTLSSRAR
jgi:hypothetical protein